MINIFRKDNKIIGIYQVFISKEEIEQVKPDSFKEYIFNKLYEELNKEDNSGLFTYNIIEGQNTEDLFGMNCSLIFEFIPNKELVEELKILAERLEIGL